MSGGREQPLSQNECSTQRKNCSWSGTTKPSLNIYPLPADCPFLHMDDRSYTSYFIVGTQRSGTTVTHHCLRGHPSVSALRGELAHDPFFTEGLLTFTYGRPGTKKEQKKGRRSLFNAVTEPERTSDTRACGVKCALSDNKRRAKCFTEVVQREFPDVKIIRLKRRDKVAQFGSLRKANKKNVWHRKNEDRKVVAPKIELDKHKFIAYLLSLHETNKILSSLEETHDIMTVEYEKDILDGELRTNSDLFSFVGVGPEEATWLEHRKVSPPPEEYITNYDELTEMQREVSGQLAAGHSASQLKEKYSPPLLKSWYRNSKYWINRPGYAAYRIGKGVKGLFGLSNANMSSS